MLRHNLLLIFRNSKRFKSSFFINLIGLSTGLACSLLIYLWINDELAIDRFHKNATRLYKIMEHQKNSPTSIRVTDSTPGLLADVIKDETPEAEYTAVAAPSYWFDKSVLSVGETNIEATRTYASKDFFNIFSFDLFQGDPNKVLTDKNSIVISEKTAMSLFNTTENIVGKSVEFQHEREFLISGIFKGTSSHSSMQFDVVFSFELYKDLSPGVVNWSYSGPMTFAVLKEGADLATFNKKIEGLISARIPEKHRTLFATSYSDMYLYGNYENGIQSGGRIEYVIQFSIIAVFIVVIACINFMNLSTAKASRRIKEVGIKKAVGANRRALIFQYIGESMLMSFLSLFISVLIVDILLPQFNLLTGKQLSLDFDARIIVSFISIAFITGLVAGSYPALYLSGFSPATVLKGRFSTSLGELWARKGLVVFQFALSVIFIVSVVVVYKQIQFLQTKNLGYDKANVVYFPIEGKVEKHREAFLHELRKLPGIAGASSIAQSMIGSGNTTTLIWDGKDPNDRTPFAVRPVNYDILEMLNVEIIDGKSFTRGGRDSLKVILNEAAVDVIGMTDPVGKVVSFTDGMKLEIIGVVKNFHYESLHVNVNPLFFILAPQYTRQVMVKIEAGKIPETLERIKSFYTQFNPGFSFDYRFLDQDYQAQYESEQRVATLSRYFAGLAILISCLGLFGLAAFTAERRLKEIGIRKVLGASEFGIIYLLSLDFTKIVITAIVIALPVSYLITSKWLSNFAYRIPLDWGYFAGAGAAALIIAWLTVGSQALRASRVNPTKCLKEE